jgi:hypothetical protein
LQRPDGQRFVLDTNPKRVLQQEAREFGRIPTVDLGLTLSLSSPLFSESKEESNLNVMNMSLGGLTGKITGRMDQQSLLPGAVLSSKTLKLNFLVVWSDQLNIGLKPVLADSKSVGYWYRFYEKAVQNSDDKSFLTRRELAGILTQSGLIKGKRRSAFGKGIADHMVSTEAESPLLAIRRVIVADNGDAGSHLTARRISEKLWILTDGASLASQSSIYEHNFKVSVESIATTLRLSPLFPRYFCSIVAKAITSTDRLLNSIEGDLHLITAAGQTSIRTILEDPTPDRGSITLFPSLSAAARHRLLATFTPAFVEAFTNNDGHHPVLGMELGKMGPYHRALTCLVTVSNNKSLIAHRLFTHNIWNTTGVTNSVFVLVPPRTSKQEQLEGLATLARHEISSGTDDFLVIFDPADKNPSDQGLNLRPFEFHLYDLMTLQTHRHVDSEKSL